MLRACDQNIVDSICRDDWIHLISQWIHNETDRTMIRRWILDGVSAETIAEENYLSVVQTQKRLKRAKEQLFKHL